MLKGLLTICFIIFCSLTTKANNSDYFLIDEVAIQEEFEQLTEIENILNVKREALSHTTSLIDDHNLIAFKDSLDFNDHLLGINPFWWGLAGGFVGGLSCYGTGTVGLASVGYVYWATANREYTKKAFLGCLIGTPVGLMACLGVSFLFPLLLNI